MEKDIGVGMGLGKGLARRANAAAGNAPAAETRGFLGLTLMSRGYPSVRMYSVKTLNSRKLILSG